MGKRNLKLPALSGFLDYATSTMGKTTHDQRVSLTCIGLPVTMAVAILGASLMERWLGTKAGVAWIATVLGLYVVAMVAHHAWRNRRVRQACHGVKGADEEVVRLGAYKFQNALHKRMHPMAAALLETAATDWGAIKTAIESPFFALEPVPQHWKEIRERIREDSDRTMLRLIVVFRQCYGKGRVDERWVWLVERAIDSKPEQLRERLHEIVDHSELRLGAEALSAMPLAVEMARDLRSLRLEVEKLPLQAIEDPLLDRPVPSSIEQLLARVEEIKRAEEELKQSLQG